MSKLFKVQWRLVAYDMLIFIALELLCYSFPTGQLYLEFYEMCMQAVVAFIVLFACRFIFRVYNRVWRFEGVGGYLTLIICDMCALFFNLIIQACLPIGQNRAFFYVALFALTTVVCIFMRMCYRYIFKNGVAGSRKGKIYSILLKIFAGNRVRLHSEDINKKINIAIAGAGRTGCALMEELMSNPNSYYTPLFFIDKDENKIGKTIGGLKVYRQGRDIYRTLKLYDIKEVVIAIPELTDERRAAIFQFYKKSDCKVKVYDYPTTTTASAKRQMRDFDIEDLMPRKEVLFEDPELKNLYCNKTVLITGGGGSIGSEIARQVAKLSPKRIVLLDIYENAVYEVQQELLSMPYKDFELNVEIISVVDKAALDTVFKTYKPDIVIHAAAHKHVPLMEHNKIEAVKNNIFGTANVIEASEKFHAYKFMMVSTDKAVNPTNVMGATKRFCEMMVQSANAHGKVRYGATRFGNVLGSAGSVVPLFRKQINNGGPITITDKRIIRYFMTIPEACNLVLQSSVMANDGELFVLDMGQPVKIYDLAQQMIDISGNPNIKIEEIGLRPGEKLFEELLINENKNAKTSNELIFIEKDVKPPVNGEIQKHIDALENAIKNLDEDELQRVLKQAIPEYKDPDEVNAQVKEKIEYSVQQ